MMSFCKPKWVSALRRTDKKESVAPFSSQRTTIELGQAAEERAYHYLMNQGLVLRERNFRGKMGEIDLIMKDHDYLVFVEVRKRTHARFGGAIESITPAKKQKIIKTAWFYLTRHRLNDKYPFGLMSC